MLNILKKSSNQFISTKIDPFFYVKRWSTNKNTFHKDSKTAASEIIDPDDKYNLIKAYSSNGFRITGDIFVQGSILLFPNNVYSWAVNSSKEITPNSLLVLDVIVPKVKVIVIGYGTYGQEYDAKLPLILKTKGYSCEMLPTQQAITTYNYLARLATNVVGAFIPTKRIFRTHEDDKLEGLENVDKKFFPDGTGSLENPFKYPGKERAIPREKYMKKPYEIKEENRPD